MTKSQLAINRLESIERVHKQYFDDNNIKIANCVVFKGPDEHLSVHIVRQDLPFEIHYEIETMFWIS